MNTFGRNLRVSLFGESHGAGVGVLLDGMPPGSPVDEAALRRELALRRPGRALTSPRAEPDEPRLLSGVLDGRTTGAPLAVWIENRDADSKPYAATSSVPRPGHADWTQGAWSGGHADLRGGGHASGRLTAGLVAAGALVGPLLGVAGIHCAAHVQQVGTVAAPAGLLSAATMDGCYASPVFTASSRGPDFVREVEAARAAGDSVGGVVEFVAEGLPVGLGDPWMDSVESVVSHLLFAIPAVKGVEFGSGFTGATWRGSRNNDPFTVADGHVRPASNHAGGILGGRTSGAPLRGRAAIKPASSIAQPQSSVDLATGAAAQVRIAGRHDPCIAIRAVPVVRACLRLALADLLLTDRARRWDPVAPQGGGAQARKPDPRASAPASEVRKE